LRRITKAALGGVAGCALVLGGTQAAVAAYEVYGDGGGLIDLRPTAEGPFDGASVSLQVKQSGDGTNFVLDVTGIDASGAGVVYGAHLHTRACNDTTEGAPAGPHYNDDVVYNRLPAEISRRTEVWFDLVPGADGLAEDDIVARDSTTVKFVPVDPDGVMSIVVHVAETDHKTGLAGARAACFTLLDASEWAVPTAPEGL
jgi:Cu/Zn superoxide dismutase